MEEKPIWSPLCHALEAEGVVLVVRAELLRAEAAFADDGHGVPEASATFTQASSVIVSFRAKTQFRAVSDLDGCFHIKEAGLVRLGKTR